MTNPLRILLVLCWVLAGLTSRVWAVQADEHPFVPYARAAAFRAGLPDLEAAPIRPGDIELRLWDGFGLTGIRGLVLERTRGQWWARVVEPAGSGGGYRLRPLPDTVAWGDRWEEAVDVGILTVAPVAHRTDGAVARDGYAVVLELHEAGRYRTAGSDAVDAACGTQIRRLLAIAEILLGADHGCRR